MKELTPSPNLEKFIELASKGGSEDAKALLTIENESLRRVSMERALLFPEVWRAVAKQEGWDKFINTSHVVDRPDLNWQAYFTLTMEDIRDGEPVDKAIETVLR
tara:strand:- start:7215 stop:7526 length:312 start_codon:yes stop_codon:yes gene_type:complete